MVYCAPRRMLWAPVLHLRVPRIMSMTDKEQELRGLESLDPHAIEALHDRYYPEVYRYVLYRLGDLDTAEDVASDVFLRLLEAAQAGRGPRQSLRGWRLRSAHHLVMDHFRRFYAGRETQLGDNLPSGADDPAHAIESIEQRRAVQWALSRLTQEQQHVLALRFGGGYSLEETADLMGKKANAIKALQFRALGALRRALKEHTL